MMFLEQGATCGVLDGRCHSGLAWFWCCHGGCGGESASDGRAGELFLKTGLLKTQNRCLVDNVNCTQVAQYIINTN